MNPRQMAEVKSEKHEQKQRNTHTHTHTHTRGQNIPKKIKYQSDLASERKQKWYQPIKDKTNKNTKQKARPKQSSK